VFVPFQFKNKRNIFTGNRKVSIYFNDISRYAAKLMFDGRKRVESDIVMKFEFVKRIVYTNLLQVFKIKFFDYRR
jgi:hypothetical protein